MAKFGLDAPEAVEDASAEYLQEEDMLGEFVDETLRGTPDGFVSMKSLYGVFRQWCDDRGMKSPWTQTSLTRALTERGYQIHRRTAGRGLLGYKLIDADYASASRGW